MFQDQNASHVAEDLGNAVVLETLSKQLQDTRNQLKEQVYFRAVLFQLLPAPSR